MSIRTKLEDIGIDTDEKEMYELAKFIWEEAQKESLEEFKSLLILVSDTRERNLILKKLTS